MNQSATATPGDQFAQILRFGSPAALAWVHGNTSFAPALSGVVRFYDTPYGGVLIEGEFFQLPNKGISGSTAFYAMHIHENGDCSASFTHTGGHYNPTHTEHPWHSGDMLPIMGNEGYGWIAFYDKRFTVAEILGRSVVLHLNADDFTSQPSGNSGMIIGCGIVRKYTP